MSFKYLEKEKRPWGTFYVLHDELHYKIKRIEVLPGQRLSYQYHHKRSENWTIVEGIATVTIDDEKRQIPYGGSIHIPLGSKHRIENNTKKPIVFIEVQTGEYFGEDDIVRIQDDYKRK